MASSRFDSVSRVEMVEEDVVVLVTESRMFPLLLLGGGSSIVGAGSDCDSDAG